MRPSPARPRPAPFSATVRPHATGVTSAYVDVAGDLDLAARDLLDAAVITCLHRRPPSVTLDMHRVSFMDCAGATGLLTCCSRALEQDVQLLVVEPSAAVTRILAPDVAAALGIQRPALDHDRGTGVRRRLECVPCGRRTPHVVGEQTVAADGAVLVQWWRCTECEEGNAIG